MKKAVLIVFMLMFVFVSMAQRVVEAYNYADVYLTDVALAGDDTLLNHSVNIKTDVEYLYDIVVELKSTASTFGAIVQPQSKLWDSDSYSNLGTAITWHGTSADTTIKFSEHSTALFDQYINLNIDGDSVTVDFIKLRVWK